MSVNVFGVRKLACAMVRSSLQLRGNARSKLRARESAASCRTPNDLKYVSVSWNPEHYDTGVGDV